MFGFLKAKQAPGIEGFEDRAFRAWGVTRPGNAQRLRLRLAFVASATSVVFAKASKAGMDGGALIEGLQEKLIQASAGLDVTISDLFDVNVPDHSIEFSMTSFLAVAAPPGVELQPSTKLNGTAALAGLFTAFGQDGAMWVHQRLGGPFGPAYAATLLVHDLAIGGKVDPSSNLEVSGDFMKTLVELTK